MKIRGLAAFIVLTLTFIPSVFTVTAQQPRAIPANDNFAAATAIRIGKNYTVPDLGAATNEGGEPVASCKGVGLVSEVVEHDGLLARAREVAELVNRNAPLAVRGTRLAIRKGLDLPLHEAEIMAEAFRERVLRTDDAKEGPLAFMEKRAPKWTAT